MSKWIHPKYNEQCKGSTLSSTGTLLSEKRKVQERFCWDLFRKKAPNGLGETSEKVQNGECLSCSDLLDEIDELNINTPQDVEERNTKSPATTSAHGEAGGRVIVNNDNSESKQVFIHDNQGFKTPNIRQQKTSSTTTCQVTTPCLFSPDLLSQVSQDVDGTPKTHHVTADDNKLPSSQSFQAVTPGTLEKEGLYNVFHDSPDILDQMIADKRSRSSLAFLSSTNLDDSDDGWSVSMATPPMHWSPTSQQGCTGNEIEDEKNNEKTVARTLFKGTSRDVSQGMSGFSILDSCEEHSNEVFNESNTVLSCSIKDDPLMKAAMNENTSPNAQVMTYKHNALSSSIKDDSLIKAVMNESTSPKAHVMTYKHSALSSSIKDDSLIKAVMNESTSPNAQVMSYKHDTLSSSIKDDSLMKAVMNESTSPNAQVMSYKHDTLSSSTKDDSLMKAVMNESTSPHAQVMTYKPYEQNIDSTNKRKNTDDSSDGTSQNDTLTMFPPILPCTSPFSQGSGSLLGLAQSTPKEVTAKSSVQQEPSDRSRIKVKRNNSRNNLHRKASRSSPSFTTRLSNEIQDKSNNFNNEAPNEDTLMNADSQNGMATGIFKTLSDDKLIGTNERDVSEISFGSLSKSLEQAMAKEAEIASCVNTDICFKFAEENYNLGHDKEDENKNHTKDQLLSLNDSNTAFPDREITPDDRNVGRIDIPLGRVFRKIDSTYSETSTKQKSSSPLLSVKRSSRIKRFSYPTARTSVLKESKDKEAGSNNTVQLDKELHANPSHVLAANNCCDDNDSKPITRNNRPSECPSNKDQAWERNNQSIIDLEQGPKRLKETHVLADTIAHKPTNNTVEAQDHTSRVADLCYEQTDSDNVLADALAHKPTNSTVEAQDNTSKGEDLCYEQTDSDKEILAEDITDRTLMMLTENTPKLSSNEQLFDMDALSQFPYDIMPSTPTSKDETLISHITDQKENSGNEIQNNRLGGSDTEQKPENKLDIKNIVNTLSGFKTASGKDVSISDEAMKKAKAEFEMANQETSDALSKKPDHSVTSGFRTASGKDEEEMHQAKAMFEMANQATSVTASTKSKHSATSGFRTASGKDVSISEQALNKARAMFEMENQETSVTASMKSKHSATSGFRTASGKDVSISEQALNKARAMFEMENQETSTGVHNKLKSSSVLGLKTASSNEVNISEESLKKAKAMLKKDNQETRLAGSKKAGNSVSSGFKTASGKDMNVSNVALQTAKAMFELENQETNDVISKKSEYSPSCGFNTANGKHVNISEEALQKAKAISENESQETSVASKKAEHPATSGFKTACGKDVNISEEALQKAKTMFELENKEHSVGACKKSKQSGFRTASEKGVRISEEAMKKANAMFEKENQETSVASKKVKYSAISGFKTASGKDVNISEDAMQKAKAMLQKENQVTSSAASKNSATSGFKTARGKYVSISDEDLKKAKTMFEKENQEPSVSSKKCERSVMSGFKTASGKDVSISDEALKKAKTMFEKENQECSVSSKKSANPAMPGFKTASGKDVNISEEALQKAKAMFVMENQECSVTSKKSEHSAMTGFKTASGKDVNITEEAMKKAKAMFEKENRETSATLSKRSEHSAMTGFKTAGGKDVNITEEALQKAKAMFVMENQETSIASKKSEYAAMSGFKTASGKDVSISDEALKKAKTMFEKENQECSVSSKKTEHSAMTGFKTASGNEENISEDILQKAKAMIEKENQETIVPLSKKSEHSTMPGFKTASGKDVNISEEALQKAKAMFVMENQETSVASKKSEHFEMSGFKTASGKDVNISEEAIQKAKAMFEKENRETSVAFFKKPEHSAMPGFKTASGKDVTISEEAIQKAKAMFEKENRETSVAFSKKPEHSAMPGFKTASGKDVNISEEAIQKAKAMFVMENQETSVASKKSEHSAMSGFKTASGKDVSISDEALKKAKTMFEKENQECSVTSKKSEHSAMPGFKTASGKDVSISDEALKKAKTMFEKENQECSVTSKKSEHSAMSGFKTAGGKDVNISEEALQKAKAMFDMEGKTVNGAPTKSSETLQTNNTNKLPNIGEYNDESKGFERTATSTSKRDQDQEVPSRIEQNSVNTSLKTAMENDLIPKTSIQESTSSSLITAIDDHLTREILESSAALLADESFTDLTECLELVPSKHSVPEASGTLSSRAPKTPLSTGPQQSKREEMMSKARQRYKSFMNDDKLNSSPSLVSRSSLKPVQPSPSTVMYDRRSKSSLTPAVVGPNTSTPLSRISSSKRENRFLTRQASPLHPRVSCPSPLSPLATNTQRETQATPTPVRTSSKKQFTTPYRSPSSTTAVDHGKGNRDGSPERKRARINGPTCYRNNASKSDNIKPVMGYLYSMSQSTKRPSIRQYVGNTLPQRYTMKQLQDFGVHDDVIDVTCSNAESFRFVGSQFFSEDMCFANQGIRMEDGGLLHMGQDGWIGLEEIESAMLDTPGVDAKLLPDGWIANHYKWIVWKLSCMEMTFPQYFAAKSLTPDRVLCQLKYRYDREIDHSQRSALKKILERDDVSSRTMVLCVCSTTASTTKPADQDKDENDEHAQNQPREGCIIELTDGWYSINTTLDVPLGNLVSKGTIHVGMKLCINGAELVGSGQAVSPLEAPSSLMLRINANSTRRACWDSRLGFQRHSHPFPLPMSSLLPNGGVIGCVDIVVLRRYPIEYMEKMASGTTAFRNSRAEEREAKKFAIALERSRETVLVKVQKEFEAQDKPRQSSKKPRRSYSPQDITKMRSGKELYDVYMSSSDPGFIEECLDNNQRKNLEDYRRLMQDNKRAELEKMVQNALEEDGKNVSKRTVVPMLKVRIVNYLNCDQDKTEAVYSIWRPTEDVVQLLSEGSRLRIYHVMASGSRYRQGLPPLQLSSTRSTRYKVMEIDQSVMDDLFAIRKTIGFNELQAGRLGLYSEVDLVGCVVHVSSHSNSSLQTVYLTDDDSNLVAVKFWGGLKVYAVDDLVKPKSIIVCTNLVVRSNEHINCPALAFNELSTLTLKPREAYLRTALENLTRNIQDMNEMISSAQRMLDQMLRRPAPSTKTSHGSLGDATNQGYNQALDTSNSTPGQTINSSTSIKSGQCKRKLLECAPEPPVSPSIYITSTDGVRRNFKRPRRRNSDNPT